MARMIPPVFDPAGTPPGERIVFEGLRDDPMTEDWVVLHSFDLPRHVSQVEGEIDFLVIIPGSGVVTLEVKSHTSVSRRDDGMWYLGGDRPTARGPFKQVSNANHSLIQEVQRRSTSLGAIPFLGAVCFPRCSFNVPHTEWESWQVIDEPALTRRTIGANLVGALHHAREKFSAVGQNWLNGEAPSPEQVDALVRLLRPRFEVFQSPSARARELDADLRRFTEEQFESLDVCELNDRVLLLGGAGTGKTLLAIEQARRFAMDGRSVLLCCFNSNLRTWMESQLAGTDLPIDVRTIHSLLLELSGISVPEGANRRFWDDVLPDAALEAIVENDVIAPRYSAVVIDEAQDVLFEPFLDVLDLIVDRGFEAVPLIAFADFEWQAIYRHGDSDPEGVAAARLGGITRYPLRTNCRNVPRIGTFVTSTIRDPQLYRSYRRSDNGVDHDLRFYTSRTNQLELLESLLDTYRNEGYRPEDIAVLSFVGDDRSAAAALPGKWSGRLAPIGLARPGQGRWCSIAAFKGLDSPAVILTDLESIGHRWDQSLLYIGASRATDRLVLLIDGTIKQDLARMIL